MTEKVPYIVWMACKLWEQPGTDRRLAVEMARHARLLWVDPPVSPATSAQGRLGLPRKIRPTLTSLDDRIARLTPTAVPGMHRAGIRRTTAPLLRAQVRWALRRTGIEPAAVVATTLQDVQGRWGRGVLSVLHGIDDYVAGAELMGLSADRLRAQEQRSVLRADVVTALSPPLAERWSRLRGTAVPVIPNGCCPGQGGSCARPAAELDLPGPVVGLVGRLNARLDLGLVEATADAGLSVLIVGPRQPSWEPVRFAALAARPGVRYVGRVSEEEAFAYMAAVDLGITPYRDSQFNRASFPLKTLDYLSAGRPVVSTALPAARWLLNDLEASGLAAGRRPFLALADDREGFVGAVRGLAGSPDATEAGRCRAFAARHTWSCRADTLAAAIGLASAP